MIKEERKSSIEFIKVIAMFLICASHVATTLISGADGMTNYSNDINFIIVSFIKNVGWIGDFIFIACSAYYLVGNKKLNLKKIFLYYIEVALVFIIYFLLFRLFKISGVEKYTFKALSTIMVFDYWYIIQYIIYLVLLPLINIVIIKTPQKVHRLLCWSFIPVGIMLLFFGWYDIPFYYIKSIYFIQMTIIMDYGKRYGKYLCFKEDNKKGLIIGLLSAIAFWIISNLVVNCLGINYSIIIPKLVKFSDLSSPVWYFIGITLMLLFKDIDMKKSKFINYISSLSLIFYVSHHNKFTALIFDKPLNKLFFENNGVISILILLGFIVFRFVYGLIVSTIFKETIHKWFNKLFSIQIKKKDIES